MARPREFDIHEVLDRCMRTFLLNGYESTSIQDLVHASGLNKASLYHTFGNKKKILLASLDYFKTTVMEDHLRHLDDKGASDPFDPIENFLYSLFSQTNPLDQVAGCLLINLVIEIHFLSDQEIFREANESLRCVEKKISDLLSSITENADQIARWILCNIQGMRVMARRGAQKHEMNAFISYLMQACRAMA